MKRLLVSLMLFMAAFRLAAQSTSVRILSQTADEIIVKVTIGAVKKTPVMTPQGEAWQISVDKGTPQLIAGAPDLPKIAVPLMIPLSGKMEAAVVEQFVGSLEQSILIAPSKGNLLRTVNPDEVPFTFDPARYQTDQLLPARAAELQNPFVFRDARGQALWVYPFQYNAASQTLITFHSITVRITKTAEAGVNEAPETVNRPGARTFDQMYRHFFANFTPDYLPERAAANFQPEKMLVVVKDNLQEGLQPLIDWKRQMGIHTTVVPLSEIGAANPDNLYQFVQNYYDTHGITYLLVVADENAMPPLMRPGSIFSCDNCLGYMSGDDHFPEVLVGRYHARNEDELKIMVQRNLDYETTPLADPQANWCATGMASTSNEGAGFGDDGQADYEHGNEWKSKHLADGFEKYWEFYDGTHGAISPTPGDPTADQPGDPVNTSLVQVMNGRGVSLYNYTGHGWEQGLSSGNFSTDAVAQLRNDHRYPIIIAVACCAGNFTNGDCLGEAVQRAGNAAQNRYWGTIASFMSSDFQSWSPPMEGQDGMNQYLVDADGVTLRPVITGMSTIGNAKMIAAYGVGGEEMADVWNPFCEPTFSPRTRLPLTLSTVHAPSTTVGATSLNVSCAVEGTQIGVYYDGQALATGVIENGQVQLEFPPLTTVGNLIVTATQFNYIPFQSTVFVVEPTEAYVVFKSAQITDTDGNNDQQANPGETVRLGVTLFNTGMQTALATQAVLSSADPYVQVLENTAVFGDIPSVDSLNNSLAFQFSVAPDLPESHLVLFNLAVIFGNNDTLHYPVTVAIRVPQLQVGDFTFEEGANSDYDGRFESGETILLTIQNRNVGDGTASNAYNLLQIDAPQWLQVDNNTQNIGHLLSASETESVIELKVADNAPVAAAVQLNYELFSGLYVAEKDLGKLILNPIVENFEAQTFTEFPWQMEGNKPWVITSFEPYKGAYCARSGLITHQQQSDMSITIQVLEAGTVQFAKKVGSEPDADFLRFYIDGELKGEWSGDVAWSVNTYSLSTGVHTLRWSYQKNQSLSVQPDRAYVDDIYLPKHELVSSGTNLPGSFASAAVIAPNPAHSNAWLQVQLKTSGELGWRIWDSRGALMMEKAPVALDKGAHSFEMPVQHLAGGMYWVQILTNDGIQTLKLAVE